MAIKNLTTAGVVFSYGVETVAGTKPTAFTRINGIKSIPSLNPAPQTLDATTLDNVEYKSYVNALKDMGGALEFKFNMSQYLFDTWEQVMEDYEALTDGKGMWFQITIPGITNSFFFKGEPSALGLPQIETAALLEASVYITPSPVASTDATWAATIDATED